MRAHSSSNSAAVVRWLRLKIAATAPTADIEWCGGGGGGGGGQHTEERTTTAPPPQQRCSLCCTAVVWRKAAAVELSRFWVARWRPSNSTTTASQHHSNLFAVRAAAALMGTTADDQISSPVQRSVQRSANIHHVVQDRYKWETTTLFGESSKDISPICHCM